MARDPEKARARKRRYLDRKKAEKYGSEAVGVDMRGRHGNHARGTENARWSDGRLIASNGYVLVRVPGGFGAGYRYEHQVVAEAAIGRPLEADETVHHLNGVKTDNRPENLTVMSRSEHARHHAAERGRTADGRFPAAPGDPDEWPPDLRVREYPEAVTA